MGARRLFTDEGLETTDTGGSDRLFERLSTLFNEKFSSLADQIGEVRRIQGEMTSALSDVKELSQTAIKTATNADKKATSAIDHVATLEQEVARLNESVRILSIEVARRDRDTNVIISGVAEDPMESSKTLLEAVVRLADTMNADITEGHVASVVRVGRSVPVTSDPSNSDPSRSDQASTTTTNSRSRPRLLKVSFNSPSSARRMLAKRLQLRNSPFSHVFINEDLTPTEQARRKHLLPMFRRLRSIVRCSLCRGDIM